MVQIDATANEHAALAVEGFPTILLFPAGSKDKKPIQYSGDRSLKVTPSLPLPPFPGARCACVCVCVCAWVGLDQCRCTVQQCKRID